MNIQIISREELLRKHIDPSCEIYNMKQEDRFLCEMDLDFNNRIFKKLDFLNENQKEEIYIYFEERINNRHSMSSLNVILNYCFMKGYHVSFKTVFLVYENENVKCIIEDLYNRMDSLNTVIEMYLYRINPFGNCRWKMMDNVSQKEKIQKYFSESDNMGCLIGVIEPEPYAELQNMIDNNQFKISQYCKIHLLTTDHGLFTFRNLIKYFIDLEVEYF